MDPERSLVSRRSARSNETARPTGDLIGATALKLFSDIGYEGATMRQIASAVGVQPASLYNHYGSKEELLWRIVQEALDQILAGQQKAFAETTTADRFRAFVRMHVRFHAERRQMARVVNNNLASLSHDHYETTLERRDKYERGLRRLLTTGCDEGIFHIRNTRIACYAVLQMGIGVSTWYREDGDIPLGEILNLYEELASRVVGYADPLTRTRPS